MEFNHIHPSYKNETEQKRIIKEKYEQIYISVIEYRKNKQISDLHF